nr:glycosyltransferase [Dysgonomonas sp. 216]
MNQYTKAYTHFEKVICVSNICRDNFIDVYCKGKVKRKQSIEVLYNALDLSKVNKCIADNPKDNKENSDIPVFIMVTRFSVEKRIDRVVESVYKLKSEGYTFKVLILGSGHYMPDFERMIEQKSLSDTISLLGYVENPYPFIRQADWLICSSERESFSLVVLESIYLRTPVITTNCGGPTEITDNGKYGLLVENSTTGIYTGMKTVMDNAHLSESYNSKAEECLKRFNYTNWLQSVEKIFGV